MQRYVYPMLAEGDVLRRYLIEPFASSIAAESNCPPHFRRDAIVILSWPLEDQYGSVACGKIIGQN